MNRGCVATALACALGLVGVVGLADCSTPSKGERRGSFLSVQRQEGSTVASADALPGSVALALGGLPAGEMTRLREGLAESTEVAVRRAAPALFDLADDDAGTAPDPLRQAMPDLPALTAAVNVLGAPWHAFGLSVTLGPTCAVASPACVPLFTPAVDRDDALVRQGRALAWTLGNAALLRVPASSRAALLRSLRGMQTRPSGTIALVFDAPRGVVDAKELGLLHDEAREALLHLGPGALQRPWLEALVAARAEWALPIPLDSDEVLVIPRLSALARLQDFHSEVERATNREDP
jgi:hypothetical protein